MKNKEKRMILEFIIELFSVLGFYYFVLIAFAVIMTSLGFSRLSEIASTIALIVMLILTIIIIEFLSSKRNKFLQKEQQDKCNKCMNIEEK